ncbi:hypothetical protein FHG64_12700 [Antarcticibacterium flavum]|uniref:ATP-binding protein n=1 Tax=Antarcticibacterium flavum TaxID=2058175 RepID=A0A5B7X6E7_9FLAO|nr:MULTISPECIES: hypothetical protein [Antarcticibacterium]MCM4158437.1 hypothetical protein [Antarcticibacterium sp. W02-3]QCY70193.1 hypothetical protein FHG64_12700 [Antarcticibacterium flavum]
MRIDIAGKVREKKLASNKALLPLFEAVVNSIHAIEELNLQTPGIIEIEAERLPQENLGNDSNSQEFEKKPPIISFKVTDNGIGFNAANWDSFNLAHSSYKYGKGGKGIGRITWLRAFSSVHIDSIYKYNGNYNQRKFDFKISKDGVENPWETKVDSPRPIRRTVVYLKNLNERFQRWTNSNLEEIAIKIIEHCFSFFREPNCPRIILKDNYDEIVVNDYFRNYTRDSLDKRVAKIKGHNFEFEVVKMYSSKPDNKIHYRAHRREVINDKLTDFIPELKQQLTDEEGEKFSLAVYVSSEYLDDKVNEERTEISFSKADEFFPDEIEKTEVSEKAVSIVREIYQEYIKVIEQERLENIRSFVRKHPRYRYLEKYKLSELKKISSNLSGKNLEIELFKLQNELERDVKRDANKMLKSIKDIDHKSAFDKTHTELYNKIIEVGNSKLAEYVVHRSYILQHLNKHLKKSKDGKYSKEEIIHNLIFPVKKTSDEIQLEEHNLWVIDERLAFHDYLASDIPLTSINRTESTSLKRPDLLIFNKAHLLNENNNYSSVVIVEFKKPMRDDYSEADNPITQILNYVIEIQENNAIDANGRPINIRKGTPFYAYIISDLTPKLRTLAKKADFTTHPDNQGFFSYNGNFELYTEIISFDKMIGDSRKRNQILFDKLNLPTH